MNVKIYYILLFCAGVFCTSLAHAMDLTVTATYKPDATQPYLREFKDTTPTAGFCLRFASVCKEKKINSSFAQFVNFEFYKDMDSSKSDLESILAVRFDNTPRTVVLREKNTGKLITAEFALTMIGQETYGDLTNGEGTLESLTKNTPVSGCTEWIFVRGESWMENYFLPHTTGNALCTKPFDPRYDSWKGQVSHRYVNIIYSLKVSSPLEAESGIYEGEVVYTLGKGKDIDYFAYDYADGSEKFHINIIATVEHAFYFRFPSGSEKVVLDAKGGWSQWVNGGTVPQSLSQNVPFRLSSSRPFKIQMRCEFNSGQGCGLKNKKSTEIVPLSVKVTMPGFTHNGQPVKNYEIGTGNMGSLIETDHYIVNQQSHIHFSIDDHGVKTMIKEPGSKWEGDVTVIFDADF